MTLSPTPGAPFEYTPLAPLLPMDATTTTPFLSRTSLAFASGACGHELNASPRLMLTMSIPSARARSNARRITSSLAEPPHPKMR